MQTELRYVHLYIIVPALGLVDKHKSLKTVNFGFKVYFLNQNRLKQKKTHFIFRAYSIFFIVLGIYNFGWSEGVRELATS